jgi:hypothetical protein
MATPVSPIKIYLDKKGISPGRKLFTVWGFLFLGKMILEEKGCKALDMLKLQAKAGSRPWNLL